MRHYSIDRTLSWKHVVYLQSCSDAKRLLALFASRRIMCLETMESASYLAVFGLQCMSIKDTAFAGQRLSNVIAEEFLLCATLMSATGVSVNEKPFDYSTGLILQSDWIKFIIEKISQSYCTKSYYKLYKMCKNISIKILFETFFSLSLEQIFAEIENFSYIAIIHINSYLHARKTSVNLRISSEIFQRSSLFYTLLLASLGESLY